MKAFITRFACPALATLLLAPSLSRGAPASFVQYDC